MQRFALPVDETLRIIDDYRERGVMVFSTPLDLGSAAALLRTASLIKVSSGDMTYSQLLSLIAKAGVDVLLSTGMATMAEVNEAVTLLSGEWTTEGVSPSLGILHCVSAYPADATAANLGAVGALKQAFPHAFVGYSDHVIGVDVAARSVAAGATIVEKHFTLDKNFSAFRDHSLSADFADLRLLRSLVDEIREEVGSGIKEPSGIEMAGREAFRRSITVRMGGCGGPKDEQGLGAGSHHLDG